MRRTTHKIQSHSLLREYLLTGLARSLLSSEEAEASARLRWSARELTRRLLSEAIASLSPAEWLAWSRPLRARPLLLRNAKRRWAGGESLLDDLAAGASTTPLDAVCARHGLSAATARALVTRHVERTEVGMGAAVRMRREVLLAFSELALRNSLDGLASLLEQDFAQPDAALPPARADVVTLLLQTLAETLAAVRVPIVFALDNMERLLAPRGPVDMPAAQSFPCRCPTLLGCSAFPSG